MLRHILRFTPLMAVLLACSDAAGPGSTRFIHHTATSDGTWPSEYAVVVQRIQPLPHDIVVSDVIGPRGGSIHIPEAGMKFEVPRHALMAPTQITIVAHAGSNVAYSFYPEGLWFGDTAAKIQQDLKPTKIAHESEARNLEAGYFEDTGDITESGLAKVREIIPIETKWNTRLSKFYVEHFSGYLVSSGRTKPPALSAGTTQPDGNW